MSCPWAVKHRVARRRRKPALRRLRPRDPGASDVDTVFRLVEDKFGDRQFFTRPADFQCKLTSDWHSFNLGHPYRGQEEPNPSRFSRSTLRP